MRRGMRVMIGMPQGMEWLIILAVVVLVFGAGKLSGVGGALGKSIREFKDEKDGLEEGKTNREKLSKAESQENNVVKKSSEVESGGGEG